MAKMVNEKSWQREEIFNQGDDYYSHLLHSLSQARESIDFEVYIFENDALGERILDRLQKVALKGIRVRILVDGFGSFQSLRELTQKLNSSPIQLRVYNPLPRLTLSFLFPWRIWKYFKLKRILDFLGKINRRNHRKVCIIDEKVAYVGGMNVSAVNTREFHGKHAWRDTAVFVEGREVIELAHAFQEAWISTKESFPKSLKKSFQSWNSGKENTFKMNSIVRLNNTLRKRTGHHRELINRILRAEKQIWITNPYFVPDFFMIRALRLAAWSGVDVRILLPKKIDVFFMSWANRAFYRILLRAGVRIFEYMPSILHAKVTIVDDWMILGSSNRNHRSLIHDLEVDIVLKHPSSLSSLRTQFRKDLSHSKEISLRTWNRRHWFHYGYEKLLLSIRNWL